MMNSRITALSGGMLCLCAITTGHTASQPQVEISGNLSILSKYIYRGATNAPENDDVTMQGGLTLGYGQFYASYWGSTLGYSFPEVQGEAQHRRNQFEHDLTFGYTFDTKGLSWDLWNNTFYYPGGDHSTGNELGINVTHEFNANNSVTATVSTALRDVVYASQGDTYYGVSYNHQFNNKLSGSATVGASYFQDNSKYEGAELGDTVRQNAFRYASVGLAYQINPHVSVAGEYILGGVDRYDDKQRDIGVVSISYNF